MARKRQQKQRASRQRQAQRSRAEEQRRLREEAERAELVYNPQTPPEVAARILLEAFGGEPVTPMVAATISMGSDEERLRAIADAALQIDSNVTALSLAADAALLAEEPAEA